MKKMILTLTLLAAISMDIHIQAALPPNYENIKNKLKISTGIASGLVLGAHCDAKLAPLKHKMLSSIYRYFGSNAYIISSTNPMPGISILFGGLVGGLIGYLLCSPTNVKSNNNISEKSNDNTNQNSDEKKENDNKQNNQENTPTKPTKDEAEKLIKSLRNTHKMQIENNSTNYNDATFFATICTLDKLNKENGMSEDQIIQIFQQLPMDLLKDILFKQTCDVRTLDNLHLTTQSSLFSVLIQLGATKVVEHIVKSINDIKFNERDKNNWDAIGLAVAYGQVEIVKLLKTNGAKLGGKYGKREIDGVSTDITLQNIHKCVLGELNVTKETRKTIFDLINNN